MKSYLYLNVCSKSEEGGSTDLWPRVREMGNSEMQNLSDRYCFCFCVESNKQSWAMAITDKYDIDCVH